MWNLCLFCIDRKEKTAIYRIEINRDLIHET